MSVKVILFPGQGSQRIGMLRELLPKYSEMIKRAESIVNIPLASLIENGPMEKLSITRYTQPAIFLTSYLHYLQWHHSNIHDNRKLIMAGHSLGEYTALCAAGRLTWEGGLRLVSLRGRIMEEQSTQCTGAMKVIQTSTFQGMMTVLEMLKKCIDPEKASIAAYNSPRQVLLSGDALHLEWACQWLKDHYKECRIIMVDLKGVSAAFHSPLMKSSAERFRKEAWSIFKEAFRETQSDSLIKVYSNVTAKPHSTDAVTTFETLVDQIVKPVKWSQIISEINSSIDSPIEFIFIPPGNILQKLNEQIIT